MDAVGTVQKLGQGRFIEDLATALLEVAEQVTTLGTPGKVTVTFDLAQPEEMVGMVTISETIARSMPKRKPRGTYFFAVGDGELHRSDPRQATFDLRAVDGAAEVRQPNDAPPAVRSISD